MSETRPIDFPFFALPDADPADAAATAHPPVVAARGAALDLDRVGRRFPLDGRDVEVLSGISLAAAPGETLVVVGASGCGKSTLLRLILGLDRPDSGRILVDGRLVEGPDTDRGIVFQDHRLFPWTRVEDNVAHALVAHGVPRRERLARARAELARVGLSAHARSWPGQLSGGQAQRVALARALVARPRILLLDEPFAALDAITRRRLQDEVAGIIRSEGLTAVMVTHDVDEAIRMGDRIVVMRPHPGRISRILTTGEARGTGPAAETRRRQITRQVLDDLGLR